MGYDRIVFESIVQFADLGVSLLNAECKEYEKIIDVSNKMLKFQLFVPLIMVSIGFLVGGLSNIYNFIGSSLYGSLCGLIGTIPTVIIASLYWGITKKYYNRKIKDIDNDIKLSLEVKKMAAYELTKLNEQENNISSSEDIIASVREYQEMIEEETKKNNNNKTKRLILKKK